MSLQDFGFVRMVSSYIFADHAHFFYFPIFVAHRSRLGCQILLREDMEGMTVSPNLLNNIVQTSTINND